MSQFVTGLEGWVDELQETGHKCCVHVDLFIKCFLIEFPLISCGGSGTGIYGSLVVRDWWRWIWYDRILFSCVRGPYVLWECEDQEILKGEWRLTLLRAKHQVLKGSDELSNVGFSWYRRYRFRKFSVHVRFIHDGCHDKKMEERIGALNPLVPSVFCCIVVKVLIISKLY